jgi:hypothetical protein
MIGCFAVNYKRLTVILEGWEALVIPFVKAPIINMKPVKNAVLKTVVGFLPSLSHAKVPQTEHTKHHAFKIMF